jgi:hypothetical protein
MSHYPHNNEVVEIILIEIVELEEHSKHHGTEAPHAHHYAFRVDKTRVVVETPTITGREILGKVGKDPAGFKLYQHKRHHQPILIHSETVVNLREAGVERFTTMPKDTTEGQNDLCRARGFALPQADEDYLAGMGLPWETRVHLNGQWLIIHDWKMPPGYNVATNTLALRIPASYSDAQIDMVYFRSPVSRVDGRAIGALTMQPVAGESWQQWSRHRTQSNPWRAGVDDVSSHLSLVDDWLRREFLKVTA